MFLNLRHNSEHVDAVISGSGRPQENRIFRFLHIHKKFAFYPNRKIFSQKFIAWNIGSDGKFIKNDYVKCEAVSYLAFNGVLLVIFLPF